MHKNLCETSSSRRRSWQMRGAVGAVIVGLGVVGWLLVRPASLPFEVQTIDERMAGDAKAIADVDGDGFDDLIIGGKAGNEDMVWYHFPDWQKFPLAKAENEFSTDMAVADMDGDGDLDAVVGDGDGPTNLVWLEHPRPQGDPRTGAWRRHAIGSHPKFVHDVEVADLDGDGRLDVVSRSESLQLWFSEVDGTFAQRTLKQGADGQAGMSLGDVTADRRIDVVVNGAYLSVSAPSSPRQASWTRHEVTPSWAPDLESAVADFNQDGLPDLVFASAHQALKVAWYEATVQADVWIEHVIDKAAGSHKINVADFNQDGGADIQIALELEEVAIYLNGPQATHPWGAFEKFGLPKSGHNLVVGDIGQDGDVDLFGANYTGLPPTRLWRNGLSDAPPQSGTLPKGSFVPKKISSTHTPSMGLSFADIDKDGLQDIVSGSFWYENRGVDGRETWPQHALPVGMMAFLTTDVDGDAAQDIVALCCASKPAGGGGGNSVWRCR